PQTCAITNSNFQVSIGHCCKKIKRDKHRIPHSFYRGSIGIEIASSTDFFGNPFRGNKKKGSPEVSHVYQHLIKLMNLLSSPQYKFMFDTCVNLPNALANIRVPSNCYFGPC